MRLKQDEAVSEILGTALLISIAILFFSFLVIIVFSYPMTPSAPYVNIVGSIDSETGDITIEHFGGDILAGDTKIFVTIEDELNEINIGTIFKETTQYNNWRVINSNRDGYWNFGEIVTYSDNINPSMRVSVTVIDDESNSVVMNVVLQSLPLNEIPSVNTLQANEISSTSANLRMFYDFVNYSGDLWFSYKLSTESQWNTTTSETKSGSGYYSYKITELKGNSEYQFRAHMQYNSNELMGIIRSFNTNEYTVSTSINPISPYQQNNLPLSVTGNNITAVDNISLYYRWSNSNWTGIWQESLAFDNFEIDFGNWTDTKAARINGPGLEHGISLFLQMDDYTNFSYDFSSYNTINLSFWVYPLNVENGDNIDILFFDGSNLITVASYNGNNNDWIENIWNSQYINIDSNDYTFSQNSYISIATDVGSNDNYYVDDIYVNITAAESTIDWSLFAIDENGLDGWSWNFNFPNDQGYYEFYSIGFLEGSREDKPGIYETKCQYIVNGE